MHKRLLNEAEGLGVSTPTVLRSRLGDGGGVTSAQPGGLPSLLTPAAYPVGMRAATTDTAGRGTATADAAGSSATAADSACFSTATADATGTATADAADTPHTATHRDYAGPSATADARHPYTTDNAGGHASVGSCYAESSVAQGRSKKGCCDHVFDLHQYSPNNPDYFLRPKPANTSISSTGDARRARLSSEPSSSFDRTSVASVI